MLADADNLFEAERKAQECIKEMKGMLEPYAMAKQVVGLRDERLKQKLAVLTAGFLKAGDSAAASEVKARADERYHEAMREIIDQTAEAQAILSKWELLKERTEVCIELQRNERAKMNLL